MQISRELLRKTKLLVIRPVLYFSVTLRSGLFEPVSTAISAKSAKMGVINGRQFALLLLIFVFDLGRTELYPSIQWTPLNPM